MAVENRSAGRVLSHTFRTAGPSVSPPQHRDSATQPGALKCRAGRVWDL